MTPPITTPVFISTVNINIETHLEMHIYSFMILIMVMVYKDKYTALLQQELQNPYWCLHDPITTKSYQISTDMDIETMPHAKYFSGNTHTVTKINHVPYQTIQYDDKGMFPAQLMDDTPIQVFIDNGATPSILPFSTYNKHPILQKYPKTKSTTPIHTGSGTIVTFLDRTPTKIGKSDHPNQSLSL